MYVKFREPYCGAKTIHIFATNFAYCAFRSYDRRWVYFDKYLKVKNDWVDKNGEIWVEDESSYLVKDTLENRLQDEHYQ